MCSHILTGMPTIVPSSAADKYFSAGISQTLAGSEQNHSPNRAPEFLHGHYTKTVDVSTCLHPVACIRSGSEVSV
jgi:hypothetical protein